MRHSWDKISEPGRAICRNCFMDVPAYRVKKGLLPKCNPPPPPPEPTLPTPICLETNLHGVSSCIKCVGHLDYKLCDGMRRQYEERKEAQKQPEKVDSGLASGTLITEALR